MDASRTRMAGAGQLPPPVRRIAPEAPPTIVQPPPTATGTPGAPAPPKLQRRARRRTGVERMRTEQLSIAYGEKLAVNAGLARASARARCWR